VKAAAPFMSGFVVYLITLSGSALILRWFHKRIEKSKYIAASALFITAFAIIIGANATSENEAQSMVLVPESHFVANAPIGTATGLKPGRVVWVWNDDATNENFTPSNSQSNWWADETDGEVVGKMLETALLQYTEETTLQNAWNALITYFNEQQGKGAVGYTTGEKFYIKINITNGASNNKKTKDFDRMDATPEVVYHLLEQLINVVGVPQSDIYVGDPFRNFHNLYWDMCHSAFPNVVYCDGTGTAGRHQTVPTKDDVLVFSDKKYEFRIPQEYVDSDYLINMPSLKTHDQGGITLGAKNHQGSTLADGQRSDNQLMLNTRHTPLPYNTPGYKKYRHIVDYLGHKDIGGKTLLTVIDGIWAGKSWQGYVEKWKSVPFNNDYPSSIFISQDKVAIDAVGYDFLIEEYRTKSDKEKFAWMDGADDYLLQAADASNWPSDISYDPEGDGIPLTSLGVYEHWNNATDKKYSRNLGTGSGIELIAVTKSDMVSSSRLFSSTNNIGAKLFPNPATEHVSVEYNLSEPGNVTAEVFNLSGQRVATVFSKEEQQGKFNHPWNVSNLNPGKYILKVNVRTKNNESSSTAVFNVK
jgi:hypothetical protein